MNDLVDRFVSWLEALREYLQQYFPSPPARPRQRRPLSLWGGFAAFGVVFVLAIVSTAGACSAPKKDTLVVGINTPFPPFEVRNGEDISGFDVDLAQRIATALGRKLVIKDFSEFDSLLPTLEAGKIDLAISAITIREDRSEVVRFSDPYFNASQAMMTLKSNSFAATGKPDDFKGKRVGYQTGTTSESWVKENLLGKVDIASTVPFGDLAVGMQMLRLKSIDVLLIDEPVATSFAKSQNDLSVVGRIDTGEQYGVAVAHNDPNHLLPAINEVIKTMQSKGKDGQASEYDNLIAKWFGGSK